MPSNVFFCHGMKPIAYASNNTAYCVSKMQELKDGQLHEPVKVVLFNANLLSDKSYKGKYFVFSKMKRNKANGGSVDLRQSFTVYDKREDIDDSSMTDSDDEYV